MDVEEAEVKQLLVQAGLDDRLFTDLKGTGLGTVMAITSYRGSAFSQKLRNNSEFKASCQAVGKQGCSESTSRQLGE